MTTPYTRAGRSARILLRALTSAAWMTAGYLNIAEPSQAILGRVVISESPMAILGILQLILGGLFWAPRHRATAAVTGIAFTAFATTALVTGITYPAHCGCFGAMELSESRHKLALAMLASLSAGELLCDQSEAPISEHTCA